MQTEKLTDTSISICQVAIHEYQAKAIVTDLGSSARKCVEGTVLGQGCVTYQAKELTEVAVSV